MKKLFKSYKKWCKYLDRKSSLWWDFLTRSCFHKSCFDSLPFHDYEHDGNQNYSFWWLWNVSASPVFVVWIQNVVVPWPNGCIGKVLDSGQPCFHLATTAIWKAIAALERFCCGLVEQLKPHFESLGPACYEFLGSFSLLPSHLFFWGGGWHSWNESQVPS